MSVKRFILEINALTGVLVSLILMFIGYWMIMGIFSVTLGQIITWVFFFAVGYVMGRAT